MAVADHHLYNIDLLKDLTVDLTDDFVTHTRKLEQTPGYAVSFSWSNASTPEGTIVLQASNDGTNYTDIQESELAVSGSSGTHIINVERPCYLYVRLKYTSTSGSGDEIICLINGVD